MPKHNRVATVLAVALAAAALVDTVVLAVTGQRTFLTDDERATGWQTLAVTVLVGAAYAAQWVVVRAESRRFRAGGRVVRATRLPLLTGLALLVVGSTFVHPLLLALVILLGVVADDLASPVFVTVLAGLGLALLGVRAPAGLPPAEPARPGPAVRS